MLLAHTESSPIWQGPDTGQATARTTIDDPLHTARIPCQDQRWAHISNIAARLVQSAAITTLDELRWDVRPRPACGAMEIRVCDGLTTQKETAAVIAFIHALAHTHRAELERSPELGDPPPLWLLRENKWRAARHGLEADVIVDDAGNTMPIRDQISQRLTEMEPIANALGYREHFSIIRRLALTGGSYSRQRHIYEQTRSLAKVAHLASLEFETNHPFFYDRPSARAAIVNTARLCSDG
jgi:carboxylate-amine ligase